MADTTHNVRVAWYVQDRNVLAHLGQMNNQLKSVTRSAAGTNAGFMQTNKYMQALGVTMRYAFAGAVIQQIRLAYQNLKLFQSGLADVVAIGTEPNGMPLMSRHLEALGQSALRTSTQTATAASDILDTYRSIYSSIPGVGAGRVAQLGSLATKGAAISETDPRTFIQSIIGMRNAFGKEAGNMNQIADQFFTVIQRSINMSGDEWAHYSGRLVAASKVANISLAQMNEMMIAMTRSGGTAAVNVRHLTQLLMRIRFPTKSAQASYAEVGLTPDKLSNMTAPEVFTRLLSHAAQLSGAKLPTLPAGFAKMSKGRQSEIIQKNAKESQAALAGPGLQFLQKAVGGRMESLRAFIVLASQLGNAGGDMKALADSSGQVNKAFDRFIQQKPIEAMGVAMTNFTTGLLLNANPLFRVLANATKSITNRTLQLESAGMNRARGADQAINRQARHLLSAVGVDISGHTAQRFHLGTDAALVGAAMGLGIGGRKLPGKLGNIFGGGKTAAAKLLTAEALPAALGGGGNGSRAAPFWVVIHPLSYAFGNIGNKNPTDHTPSGLSRLLSKAKGLLPEGVVGGALFKRFGAKVLPGTGAAIAAYEASQIAGNKTNELFGIGPGHPFWKNPNKNPQQNNTILNPSTGGITSLLHSAARISHSGPSRVSGGATHLKGELHFRLEPTGKLEGLIKPIDKRLPWPTVLWGEAAPPPTSRGKPSDKRTH